MDSPIWLIKIDTEGHEFPIFKGMEGLLSDTHSIMFEWSKIGGVSLEETLEFLGGYGFTISRPTLKLFEIKGNESRLNLIAHRVVDLRNAF